jgi:hypothetical protein
MNGARRVAFFAARFLLEFLTKRKNQAGFTGLKTGLPSSPNL